MSALRTSFFVLFCVLGIGSVFAQQVRLKGRVLNSVDVESIHVLNKSKGTNTITNQNGEFTIRVSLLDTLYLSSIRYSLKEVIVDAQILNSRQLNVTLTDRVTELDEVYLGPKLSGNLTKDAIDIKTEKPLNFDDVGIPGFKGKPQEKIVPIVPGIGTFTTLDVEALYKHISGYYRKLRLRRKWEAQNNTVALLLGIYNPDFFEDAYGLPKERIYDFLLFCIETTSIQRDYDKKDFGKVLGHFKENAQIYLARLAESKD